MKIKSCTLAILLALTMLLTACGGASTPTSQAPAGQAASSSTAPAPEASGDPVEITFWSHYTDDLAFTQKKVKDYNDEMSGKVTVNFKHVADDYINVLMMAMRSGDAPDIYADGPLLADLVSQGYAAPLDNIASPEMLERAESFKQDNNNYLDGHWYSFPFRGYNFRLAWNKDMFRAAGLDPEKPPKSYDEFLSMAKTLSEYGATQTPQQFGFMLPTGEDWIWWIYGLQMGRVNGESYYDFTTGKYTWEAMKPVMQLYLDLKNSNCLFPGGTSMQNDPARAQFSAGNAGMIVAASWDIGVFNDQFPAEIEWDVTTLPNIDGTLKGYSQLDCGSYLLVNNGDKQKEAMAFYEYLLSEPVLVEYYENGYGIPVYPGVAEKATKVPDRPGFSGFATVENDRVYPYEPPVQGLIEGPGYGAVLNDVLNGKVSIDDAIADLNKRYADAMEIGVKNGEFKIEDYIVPNGTPMHPFG